MGYPVLGADPGFKHCGVSVVDASTGRLLRALTLDLGEEPLRWRCRLFPQLDALHAEFGIRGVGTESPVFLYGAVKKKSDQPGERQFINQRSTVGIFGSAILIEAWAASHGIPFTHARPMAIKQFACLRTGEPFDYHKPPQKAAMVRMAAAAAGEDFGCHHAADAYFAGLALYSSIAA